MSLKILTPKQVSNTGRRRLFTKTLLHWFRRFGRDLPWRRTRNPYKILVSEIMLQQTQVERVKDYYHRFLDRFPTVESLAEATETEALEAWEGLGYYNRARNLRKSAIVVCEEFKGIFPETVEELESLPGIGRYTAGAIVSFAFVKPAPILDTNVKRVLERVFVKRRHSSTAKQERRLWKLAESVIAPRTVWEINQALMDFGAQICTAKNPKCGICPMRSFCVEYQRNKSPQMEFPYSENGNSLSKAAEPYVPYAPDEF
ncbi:MAG: A/G-specific adenine glycosylase [Candidatus Marinimicrobia bacterium]|nr:A/G-specific adenine glycosylase [Candidatus Neomarinimicrobiota bacterium]MCF7828047.1 A/G-specific adenine glycosylase [Candidatus Neomarinimicrobiota bacterium]MCF7879198.1 A/G-specific adenine glycosylase [Candidatus Neomarinimicrobiota bacterium]